ncbi:MAG TPA: RsmD family RNA methyltransferase, partial [Candidatus Caenarcaniphilales bacterium]|nr:RsmD family RNA methyltransferase [Candidatus Caenarcaniphilales bacterium]
GARLVRQDVLRFLDSDPRDVDGPFSAVLVDPPYDQPMLRPALERLGDASRGWLRRDGIVAGKHFWRDAPPRSAGELEAYRERRFGATMLTFYRFARPASASSSEET